MLEPHLRILENLGILWNGMKPKQNLLLIENWWTWFAQHQFQSPFIMPAYDGESGKLKSISPIVVSPGPRCDLDFPIKIYPRKGEQCAAGILKFLLARIVMDILWVCVCIRACTHTHTCMHNYSRTPYWDIFILANGVPHCSQQEQWLPTLLGNFLFPPLPDDSRASGSLGSLILLWGYSWKLSLVSVSSTFSVALLSQGSENLFCKGPGSKYFSLCKPYGLLL